jgi:hypothetical protein
MPSILLNAIVSGQNQAPFVHVLIDEKMIQLTPDEARSPALQVMTVAEAATGDAFLVHFMGGVGKGDTEHESQMGALLHAFRDYRMNMRAKGDPLQWGEVGEWPDHNPPTGR